MKSKNNFKTLSSLQLQTINGGRNIISDLGWIIGIGLHNMENLLKTI